MDADRRCWSRVKEYAEAGALPLLIRGQPGTPLRFHSLDAMHELAAVHLVEIAMQQPADAGSLIDALHLEFVSQTSSGRPSVGDTVRVSDRADGIGTIAVDYATSRCTLPCFESEGVLGRLAARVAEASGYSRRLEVPYKIDFDDEDNVEVRADEGVIKLEGGGWRRRQRDGRALLTEFERSKYGHVFQRLVALGARAESWLSKLAAELLRPACMGSSLSLIHI
eukprot:5705622-Prymnesium_polylepis.1